MRNLPHRVCVASAGAAFAFAMLALPYEVYADVKCSVSVSPLNRKYIEVLVDSNDIASNEYLHDVKVSVVFRSGGQRVERQFDFTDELQRDLLQGMVYRRYFSHSEPVSVIESAGLDWIAATIGEKADGINDTGTSGKTGASTSRLDKSVDTTIGDVPIGSGTSVPFVEVPGVGDEGQGAGATIAELDGNDSPDVIFMAYDNPPGPNTFRYRVGWNMREGKATSWSDVIEVAGVGDEGQGADVVAVDIDEDGRQELVLVAYDNPPRDNAFRYRIGWALDSHGVAGRWDGWLEAPGVGWEGQGAGVAVGRIDGNARPELVVMAYDNPPQANSFRYRVGWDLGHDGNVARWGDVIEVEGVGYEGQGAGVAMAQLDQDSRPELVLVAYDNPVRENTFRYRVGWNVGADGVATRWSETTERSGFGWEGQGAGVIVGPLLGAGQQDLLLMAYDNPNGANTFRYVVIRAGAW